MPAEKPAERDARALQPAPPPAPSGPRRSRGAFAIGCAALVGLSLLLLLTDAGHAVVASAGTVAHRATPAPRATKPSTATPTPAPRSGFLTYADQSGGYRIQYPLGWVYSHIGPATEFADSGDAPSYEVQVLVPANLDTVDLGGADPSDAASWTNYALTALAHRYRNEFAVMQSGPTVATFGRATWRVGAARIASGTSSIRVDVYATVHTDKPYIISLLTADTSFSSADARYFAPMLRSFEFLPGATAGPA
jgi:hypothetical protein